MDPGIVVTHPHREVASADGTNARGQRMRAGEIFRIYDLKMLYVRLCMLIYVYLPLSMGARTRKSGVSKSKFLNIF